MQQPASSICLQVGDNVTKEQMKEFVWATLKSGKVRLHEWHLHGWAGCFGWVAGQCWIAVLAQLRRLPLPDLQHSVPSLRSLFHHFRHRWCPALATQCCARQTHATPARRALRRATCPTTRCESDRLL